MAQRGLLIHTSVYAALEARGKADTPGLSRLVERIADFYGTEPPRDEPAAGQGMGDLIAAIRAQTDALTAVVDELRGLAADRSGEAAAATEVLGHLARLLAAPAGTRAESVVRPPADDLPAAPPASAGTK